MEQSSLEAYLLNQFGVVLLPTHTFTTTNKADQLIRQTPIEELLFSRTALDSSAGEMKLAADLLVEIKSVRNVSKPYQRATDVMVDDEPKEQKIGPKKGQMYSLIAHDGVRFVKLVLLFAQQAPFINKMHESNKFFVKKGAYISRPDGTLQLMIDRPDQLVEFYVDNKSQKIIESHFDIKGLPIKYTNAPKFKFINDRQKGDGQNNQYDEQLEEEVEDEHADLFKKFDVPDLSSHERIYLQRFQQLGFWRKKF